MGFSNAIVVHTNVNPYNTKYEYHPINRRGFLIMLELNNFLF